MKKLTSVLFVFALIFTLLGSSGVASAQVTFPGHVTALQPGCTSTVGYSPVTGARCDIPVPVDSSLPAGCTSTRGYSPTTGIKCDTPPANSSLPAGCTSTRGYSPTTGIKCDSGATSSLPPGCYSTVGYSVTTGQRCSETTPIPVYPPGCNSIFGYSSTTGQRCDGTTTSPTAISAKLISQNIVVKDPAVSGVASEAHGEFRFTVHSPSGDIQIYRMAGALQRSVQVMFGNANIGNPTSIVLTATSPSTGSDHQDYYTIKKGETRSFNLSFVINPTNGTGYYKAKAVSLAGFAKGTDVNFGSEFTTNIVYLSGAASNFSINLTSRGIETKPEHYTVYYKASYTDGFPTSGFTIELSCSPEFVSWSYTDTQNMRNCTNRSDHNTGIDMKRAADGSYEATIIFHNKSTQRQSVIATAKAWGGVDGKSVIATSNRDTVTLHAATAPVTQPSNSITILSPNGGEVWKTGSRQTIRWSVDDPNRSSVSSIDFTLRNTATGAGHDLYLMAPNTGSVTFDLSPSYPVGTYTLRAEGRFAGTTNTSLIGQSNSSFTISAPTTQPSPVGVITSGACISPSVYGAWAVDVSAGQASINGKSYPINKSEGMYGSVGSMDLYAVVYGSSASINGVASGKTPSQSEYAKVGTVTFSSAGVPTYTHAHSHCTNRTAQINPASLVGNVIGATATSTTPTQATASPASFRFTQFLEEGSYGTQVKELQKILNNAGYDAGNVDGIFGSKVKEALIKFQTANGLKADGMVGYEVRTFLNR